MRSLRILSTCALLGAVHVPAAAQHGEVQLGAVASYGPQTALGMGGGPAAGIVLGRLVYFGMRFVVYEGGTELHQGSQVETGAQTFLTDLGFVIPAGAFELVPGVSIGTVRVKQRSSAPPTGIDLVVAPGVSVHTYLAGLVLIPEVQYLIAGRPDIDAPPDQSGLVFALRLALPIEVGRIRY